VKVTEEDIRGRVRTKLAEERLKPADLAKLVGHSGSWATNYLNGKKGVPLDTLLTIAERLKMDVCELLVGQPSAVPKKEQSGDEMFREYVYAMLERMPSEDRISFVQEMSKRATSAPLSTQEHSGTQSGAS